MNKKSNNVCYRKHQKLVLWKSVNENLVNNHHQSIKLAVIVPHSCFHVFARWRIYCQMMLRLETILASFMYLIIIYRFLHQLKRKQKKSKYIISYPWICSCFKKHFEVVWSSWFSRHRGSVMKSRPTFLKVHIIQKCILSTKMLYYYVYIYSGSQKCLNTYDFHWNRPQCMN